MAWLLRHPVRATKHLTCFPVPSLRALEPSAITGSKFISQRWFAENATFEESTSNTAGSSSHVEVRESVANGSSNPDCKAESLSSSGNNENKESNDKLASLILNKMRGKSSASAHKENGVQRGGEQQNSLKPKVPEDENAKSIQDSKWAQVMNSIRKMAAKNREEADKKEILTKTKESESHDDFADLDLPQGEKVSFSKNQKSQDKPCQTSFKKDYPSNNHQRGPNQHRGRFLNRQDGSERSPADRTRDSRDSFSTIKPRDTRSQGWSKQTGRESKPVSFNFLKPSEANDSSVGLESNRTANVNDSPLPVSRKEAVIPNSGYAVCVQNIPADSSLALVKEALLVHGEIVSCFRKPDSDKSSTVYVEFKVAEAMDSALSARSLSIDGVSHSIVRADMPITTVVRLSKVSGDTTENQILSVCSRYGSVDTIRRRGNTVYDVFYRVRELPNMNNILESLNEVTLNNRRWVALPAPNLHPAVRKEVLNTSDGRAWYSSQLQGALNRIEMGLDSVLVSFDDLKALTRMEDEMPKR